MKGWSKKIAAMVAMVCVMTLLFANFAFAGSDSKSGSSGGNYCTVTGTVTRTQASGTATGNNMVGFSGTCTQMNNTTKIPSTVTISAFGQGSASDSKAPTSNSHFFMTCKYLGYAGSTQVLEFSVSAN